MSIQSTEQMQEAEENFTVDLKGAEVSERSQFLKKIKNNPNNCSTLERLHPMKGLNLMTSLRITVKMFKSASIS